jgi:hypothetical protein
MAPKKKDKASSTGLQKFLGREAKMYDIPKKGSGKPKYKNTIKEARLNTKEGSPLSKSNLKRAAGKKVTKSEAQATRRKEDNTPKAIAKEEKIRTGVNTAKPTTPKVPVKPRGGMRGGGMLGGGGGMNRTNR